MRIERMETYSIAEILKRIVKATLYSERPHTPLYYKTNPFFLGVKFFIPLLLLYYYF